MRRVPPCASPRRTRSPSARSLRDAWRPRPPRCRRSPCCADRSRSCACAPTPATPATTRWRSSRANLRSPHAPRARRSSATPRPACRLRRGRGRAQEGGRGRDRAGGRARRAAHAEGALRTELESLRTARDRAVSAEDGGPLGATRRARGAQRRGRPPASGRGRCHSRWPDPRPRARGRPAAPRHGVRRRGPAPLGPAAAGRTAAWPVSAGAGAGGAAAGGAGCRRSWRGPDLRLREGLWAFGGPGPEAGRCRPAHGSACGRLSVTRTAAGASRSSGGPSGVSAPQRSGAQRP